MTAVRGQQKAVSLKLNSLATNCIHLTMTDVGSDGKTPVLLFPVELAEVGADDDDDVDDDENDCNRSKSCSANNTTAAGLPVPGLLASAKESTI